MKPDKLKIYLETKYLEFVSKPKNVFCFKNSLSFEIYSAIVHQNYEYFKASFSKYSLLKNSYVHKEIHCWKILPVAIDIFSSMFSDFVATDYKNSQNLNEQLRSNKRLFPMYFKLTK